MYFGVFFVLSIENIYNINILFAFLKVPCCGKFILPMFINNNMCL